VSHPAATATDDEALFDGLPFEHVTTHQMLAECGATYRQLDYWARAGYLRPTHVGGSGFHRSWPLTERRVACLMTTLVNSGLTVPAAARAARWLDHVGADDGVVQLGPGVTLVVRFAR
jgi:hypothetical protein